MSLRVAPLPILGDSRSGPPVGVGLRGPHVSAVLASRPETAFFEVHPENYMDHASASRALERIREDYPLSLHGVALSLGGVDPIDRDHLDRLKRLVDRLDPFLVSEHLAWTSVDGFHFSDLLPLPYTEEVLDVVSRNVDAMQQRLGRPVLVENPARCLRWRDSTMDEAAFLTALVRRTGCGLLCDIANVVVSAHNIGIDAEAYLAALPAAEVREFHLAGQSANDVGDRTMLIDDHASPVSAPVWDLYESALRIVGARPTIVEWDADLPDLPTLLAEAAKARARAGRSIARSHVEAA